MKKTVLVVVAAVAVMALAGCAAQQNPLASWTKELRDESQNIATALADKKVTTYAISYYRAGWLTWNGVTDEPLPADDKNMPATAAFGELLSSKAEELFRERGVRLFRAVNVAALAEVLPGNITIEMRVATMSFKQTAFVASSRWVVYCCNKKNVPVMELYQMVSLPLTTAPKRGADYTPYYAETASRLLVERFFDAIEK